MAYPGKSNIGVPGLAPAPIVHTVSFVDVSLGSTPGTNIGGFVTSVGSVMLLLSQTTTNDNGIYLQTATGLLRHPLWSIGTDVTGSIISVQDGTYASKAYKFVDGAVVGSSPLTTEELATGAPANRFLISGFVEFTSAEPLHTEGAIYINTNTGTGSITTGQTFTVDKMYKSVGGLWLEIDPVTGWEVYDQSGKSTASYNGTTWIVQGGWKLLFAVAPLDGNVSYVGLVPGTYDLPTGVTQGTKIDFIASDVPIYLQTQGTGQIFSAAGQIDDGAGLIEVPPYTLFSLFNVGGDNWSMIKGFQSQRTFADQTANGVLGTHGDLLTDVWAIDQNTPDIVMNLISTMSTLSTFTITIINIGTENIKIEGVVCEPFKAQLFTFRIVWYAHSSTYLNTVTNVTADYTVKASDKTLNIDSTGGDIVITIPDGLPNGMKLNFYCLMTANTVTVNTSGTELIVDPVTYSAGTTIDLPGIDGLETVLNYEKILNSWEVS